MGILDIFKGKEDKNYLKKTHFFSFYQWAVELFKHFHDEHEQTRSWMQHLHQRTSQIEELQKNQKESTEKTLRQAQIWIHHMHDEGKTAKKDLEKTQELLKLLYQQHKETIKILDDMKKEHESLKQIVSQNVTQRDTRYDTKSVTMTNDDTSPTRKQAETVDKEALSRDTPVTQNVTQMTSQEPSVTRNDTKTAEISVVSLLQDLNVSEKRVVYLLIHSEKSLGYQDIAEKLEMNYSTVKNIIYRLRKRGFPVEDTINRRGEKEFYIAQHLKIALKTRK